MFKIAFLFLFAGFVLSGCANRAPAETPAEEQTAVQDDGIAEQQDAQNNKEVADTRSVARVWIENESPTYVFDGFDLKFNGLRKEGDMFVLNYSFSSRHAGYGERTGYVLAQIITPHSIEVVVHEGAVVSAVTDEVFDEVRGKRLNTPA